MGACLPPQHCGRIITRQRSPNMVSPAPMPATPLQVLVVEDDVVLGDLIAERLRDHGHTVTTCAEAEGAWEAWQREHHALLLVDWMLPGRNGLDLCQQIRASMGGEQPHVLIITGHNRPEHLAAVLDAGAD